MTLIVAVVLAAQIGGKPVVGGNPTPGTPQPEPPNVAERVTVTGCVERVAKNGKPLDGNTVLDSRYALMTLDTPPKLKYRLSGIESQLSPFAGSKVEVTGEPKNGALQVEFVQKLATTCK